MAGFMCDSDKPQDVLLLEQDNCENAVFWGVTPFNVVETFISEQRAASACIEYFGWISGCARRIYLHIPPFCLRLISYPTNPE